MWTAKIINTTYGPGYHSAKVAFTNGNSAFDHSKDFDNSGGESTDNFHIQVQNWIDHLDRTDKLNAEFPPNGDFTPVIPEPSDEEKLRQAINKIEFIKKVQELGIVTPSTPKENTDAALSTAISDAQDAFDPANL